MNVPFLFSWKSPRLDLGREHSQSRTLEERIPSLPCPGPRPTPFPTMGDGATTGADETRRTGVGVPRKVNPFRECKTKGHSWSTNSSSCRSPLENRDGGESPRAHSTMRSRETPGTSPCLCATKTDHSFSEDSGSNSTQNARKSEHCLWMKTSLVDGASCFWLRIKKV